MSMIISDVERYRVKVEHFYTRVYSSGHWHPDASGGTGQRFERHGDALRDKHFAQSLLPECWRIGNDPYRFLGVDRLHDFPEGLVGDVESERNGIERGAT